MVTKEKNRTPSDVAHWEVDPNYTREAFTIEGLDGFDFVAGVPLEPGTGNNMKAAAVGGSITALLLTNIGSIATGATAVGTALVRGSAIVIDENLLAGDIGVDAGDTLAAIKANQLPGVIAQSSGLQSTVPNVTGP